MTNSQSRLKTETDAKLARRRLTPPIDLERPTAKDYKRHEHIVVKCRTDPSDSSSPPYDLPIILFGTGTCEEWLIWRKNFKKALKGQGVTTGPGYFSMARRLLTGDALGCFEVVAATCTSETTTSCEAVLKEVDKHVMPTKAMQIQKRYMRRYMRKPSSMKIQDFVYRVSEINDHLVNFPVETGTATKISDDELMEILEFAVSEKWRKQMLLHGFDPQVSTKNSSVISVKG